MASGLLGSFPNVSSITTGGRCSRSKHSAKYNYASSIITKTVWKRTREIQNEYSILSTPPHNLKHHYYKGASDEFERKFFMNAISTQSNEFEPQAHIQKSILDSLKDGMGALYKFSRPYALIGMMSGVCSTSLLAVERLSDLSPKFCIGFLQYMVPHILMQLYHNGVNQLADLEIDKINKPYLPLASGEISFKTGVIIVSSFAIMSFGLGLITGSKPLLWALLSSFVLGSAYSVNLPLLRWKRSTILTGLYTIAFPVIAFNLGPFFHLKAHVLKRTMTYPKSFILSILMSIFFCAVITIAKDLHDIEGDQAQGIQTLAVRLGPKRVFWISVSLIEMAYGVAILVGATSPILWSKIFTVLAHAILASTFWYQAKIVDLKNKDDLQSFYMLIFKFLSLEYFMATLVR